MKWEGAHPTGSTKDPMAVVALADMYARGVREFAFSSTGNTTGAFARALLCRPELTAHVFVPAGFPSPPGVPPNLVVHQVAGDYVEAQRAAGAFCRDGAVVAEGGFASVGRREGLKIAYLEALLAAPRPPTLVVQAISSGMGMLAAGRAIEQLRALGLLAATPRLVAAQQDSCAPMVTAFTAGSPVIRSVDVVPAPAGRAVATRLGDPSASYPYVRDAGDRRHDDRRTGAGDGGRPGGVGPPRPGRVLRLRDRAGRGRPAGGHGPGRATGRGAGQPHR
jgi:threonine synthase